MAGMNFALDCEKLGKKLKAAAKVGFVEKALQIDARTREEGRRTGESIDAFRRRQIGGDDCSTAGVGGRGQGSRVAGRALGMALGMARPPTAAPTSPPKATRRRSGTAPTAEQQRTAAAAAAAATAVTETTFAARPLSSSQQVTPTYSASLVQPEQQRRKREQSHNQAKPDLGGALGAGAQTAGKALGMAFGGRPPRSKATHHEKSHQVEGSRELFKVPSIKPRRFSGSEDVSAAEMPRNVQGHARSAAVETPNPLNAAVVGPLAVKDDVPNLADIDTDTLVETENTRLWV